MTDLLLALSSEARDLLVKSCGLDGATVLRLTGAPFELMAAGLVSADYVRLGATWWGYVVRATDKGFELAESLRRVA